MMTDGGILFSAYEYGNTIGMPASEVLKLPVAEFTTGFIAYKNVRRKLLDENNVG